MTDSPAIEQKKSRRGLLALVGAGGAAAVAALLGRSNGAEAASGDNFVLGDLTNDAGSHATKLTANLNGRALHVGNNSTDATADGVWGETSGTGGWGVYGNSSGSAGTGVRGYCGGTAGRGVSGECAGTYGEGVFGVGGQTGVKGLSGSGSGVKGIGKPGVYGISTTGAGVRGDGGGGADTVGLYGVNTPDQRALRTKGRVQMDTARKVTLSNMTNLVKLPTGVQAGAFAIVLAMVQGASGNGAFVRRAFRVDDKHIRITFDKKPANPTAVGYWVVQTG